jgi:hypothetical protein
MSALINLSIRVDQLQKQKFVAGKDGKVYYNFTIAVNDEANQFGQNVSAYDSQTKEEREAKKSKLYIGNGNVIWNDGKITTVKKENIAEKAQTVEDNLPF